jgi:SAM-dependent methyltransferase
VSGLVSPFASAWSVVADAAHVGGATSLLDLGCGDGAFCVFAAERGATVHGLDAEPDAIALALDRVPAGEFRLGLMEHLPWPDNSFDVVLSFNALQYALDPELALIEACRVLRPGGRIAICKWGPAAENEFFIFLASIRANGVHGDRLPLTDPVDDAIRATRLKVLATGDVEALIEMADADALEASLSRAGIVADPVAATGETDIAAAAAPYRQADGAYRFGNRLRCWILAP